MDSWIGYRYTYTGMGPVLASTLLCHFSYIIICVDKLMSQCTCEKWSLVSQYVFFFLPFCMHSKETPRKINVSRCILTYVQHSTIRVSQDLVNQMMSASYPHLVLRVRTLAQCPGLAWSFLFQACLCEQSCCHLFCIWFLFHVTRSGS